MTNKIIRRYFSSVLFPAALTAAVLTLAACSGGGSDDEDQNIVSPEKTELLYVQQGSSGKVIARRSTVDLTVTLEGVEDQTVYYSDGSEHQAGSLNIQTFVDKFGWSPNRPNAALVFRSGDSKTTAIVAVAKPVYDSAAGTLTYTLTLLDGSDSDSLGDFEDGAVDFIPDTFTDVSLYIDDDTLITCSGAMAAETLVGTPGTDLTAGSILEGDTIRASADGRTFGDHPVVFTALTPSDESNEMAFVRVGDNTLIGSPTQCVVRGDLSVIPLALVISGERLLFSDGSIRTVDLVSIGDYEGPVAAVSTDTRAIPGSGRFISANGFVVSEHLWTGALN